LCPSDEEIYLAGLLHDIGLLVLDFIAPKLSDQLHTRLLAEPECSMEEMEAKLLEMSHSELGAQLASHWALPETLVAVLRGHHAEGVEQSKSVIALTAMLRLAAKLLADTGIFETADKEIRIEDWQTLSIDPLKAEDIVAKVEDHIKNIEPSAI